MGLPAPQTPPQTSAPTPPLRLATDAPAAGPLSAEQLTQLAHAEKRARKIRRAGGVAAFGGYSAMVFALLTAAMSVFNPVGIVLAAAIGIVAYHELTGRAELRRFEPRAVRRLALNQLFLGVAIVAYGSWKLTQGLNAPMLSALGSTGDPQTDQLVTDLARTATVAVYAGVIAIGVIVPGLTAAYYASRGTIVRDFLRTTPGWIVDLMRARENPRAILSSQQKNSPPSPPVTR